MIIAPAARRWGVADAGRFAGHRLYCASGDLTPKADPKRKPALFPA